MSAPNLKEIEWAISELEKEESSFPVYAKLPAVRAGVVATPVHAAVPAVMAPYIVLAPVGVAGATAIVAAVIEWAISELEKEESSFPVYAKLANLYTVRNELMGASTHQPLAAMYSGT